MTDLQTTAAKVAVITPETPDEQIADILYTLEGMAQRIKELRAEMEQRLLEKVQATGSFTIGDMLYTLAKPKKVKVRDRKAVAEKILELGDVERLCECLAANAWKHGAVKQFLDEAGAPGETFDVLFETVFEEELKVTKVNLTFAGK